MAYQINFTDSVNKGSIEVVDNDINTDTSLRLPGRGATNFGEAVNTNFLHLLENFADNNPPSNPVEGQLWIFPSSLSHCVAPNRTDEDRISVSFNIVF